MAKSTGMQRSARQLLGTGRAVVAAATAGAGTTRRSATSSSASRPYYNYILVSESTQRTYNGITNDLERRLRQHRGEAPGGAKSTRTAKDWTYLAVVGCPNWGPAAARDAAIGSPGGGSSAGGGHGSDNGGGGGSRGKAASGAAAAASFEARLRYPTGTRPRPARFAGPEGRLRGLCLVLQAQAEGQAEVLAAAMDTAAVRPAAARQAAAASSAPAVAGQSPGSATEPSTPEHRPGPPQAGGGTGHTAVAPIAATVRKRRRSAATAGSLPTSTAPAPALEPAPAPPNATMPSTIAVGALWTQPAAHVLAGAEAEPLQPTAVEQRAGGATHACSDRQAAPGAWVWVHPRYRDCSAVAGCAVLRAAMAAAEALRGAGSSNSNSNSSNDEDSSSKDGSGSGSRKSSRGRGAGAGSVGGDVRMAAALAALDALDVRAAAELGQPRSR